MQKNERQDLILEMIAADQIARQDEIASRLRERGFAVTQASISRDLDELGIVKTNGRYARAMVDDAGASPFGISSVEPAGENLIVIRCSAGLASAAAVRLDGERLKEIVGTIAGDDTIFVAVKDRRDQKAAQKKIRAMFTS